MGACNGKLRAATVFLWMALLCGCAAPREAVKPEEPEAKPVSVRLPVLTPMKIEPPTTPPGSEQTLAPTEVEEGKARSLKMIEVDYTRGKQGPPVEESPPAPPENKEKP
jgi:hypothetical protein